MTPAIMAIVMIAFILIICILDIIHFESDKLETVKDVIVVVSVIGWFSTIMLFSKTLFS